MRRLGSILAFCCAFSALGEELVVGERRLAVELLHQEDFEGPLRRWRFDGRGRVWGEEGRLQMDAGRFESTAWFTEDVEGDFAATWEAHIVSPGGPRNINLIFLATATDGGDVLGVPFTGQYSEYHRLPNYIWTLTSTHTRLRRNPGFELLSEKMSVVTESHRTYRLALTVEQGHIRCYVDGRLIHDAKDAASHRRGKLAFRTYQTRLWWDNLRIYRVTPSLAGQSTTHALSAARALWRESREVSDGDCWSIAEIRRGRGPVIGPDRTPVVCYRTVWARSKPGGSRR